MRNSRILALILFAALEVSGTPSQTPPTPILSGTCTLGVPLVAQIGSWLCWAACTEMVSTYYHTILRFEDAPVRHQCELARNAFCLRNNINPDTLAWVCSGDTIPESFNWGGNPFPAFDSDKMTPYYAMDTNSGATITCAALQSAFAQQEPMVFAWGAVALRGRNSLTHFMVAEGCCTPQSAPQDTFVSINDPWPIDSSKSLGRHAQIAFSEFQNTSQSIVGWKRGYMWSGSGTIYGVRRRGAAKR